MARREGTGGTRIGERLEAARTEMGLDLQAVEEQTRIRKRYLRALEEDDWDALPGPAYATGFLRTYAQLLGLDADHLVGELRHQIDGEAPVEQRYPLGEPVLRGRERSTSRWWGVRVAAIAMGLALMLAAGLSVALIIGDDPPIEDAREPRAERHPGGSDANRAPREESKGPVTLHLILRSDVPVCLLGDGSQPLVDNQVLNAGSEERFTADRFELRFPEGFDRSQLQLELNGHRVRLQDPQTPAAFRLTAPARVKSLGPPREDCP